MNKFKKWLIKKLGGYVEEPNKEWYADNSLYKKTAKRIIPVRARVVYPLSDQEYLDLSNRSKKDLFDRLVSILAANFLDYVDIESEEDPIYNDIRFVATMYIAKELQDE